MFENYRGCLFNDKITLQVQQRFKSDHRKVYTEQINKITLSSNDDKRLPIFYKMQHIHSERMFLKYAKVR